MLVQTFYNSYERFVKYICHTSSCLNVDCGSTRRITEFSMRIDRLNLSPTNNSTYLGYIRFTPEIICDDYPVQTAQTLMGSV